MSTISAGTTSTTTLIATGDTTGSLVFKTNDTGSGGTTAMTIDTSQNVGIGGTPYAYGAGYTNLWLQASTTPVLDLAIGSTRTGSFYASSTAVNFGTITAVPLIINTANTERARIDSSGNLLVGTTSNPYNSRGYFVGNSTYGALALSAPGSGSYYPAWFNDSDATSTSQQMVHFTRNGTVVGYITTTNAATSYSSASDYRLKEDIHPMTNALAKVAQLKPVTYKWKSDGSAGEGFIAHELAEVCPIAVYGEKDGVDAEGNPDYQGIDTSFLVATLTAAIQELKALNDAQASTITQLTERISALENK